MKMFTMAAAIIGTVAVLSMSNAPRAQAGDNFSFSFDTGGVAFAYSDGYWDHDHQWHRWQNAREAREYRSRYAENYHGYRHTRDHDKGWHDSDHGGGPDRHDSDHDSHGR